MSIPLRKAKSLKTDSDPIQVECYDDFVKENGKDERMGIAADKRNKKISTSNDRNNDEFKEDMNSMEHSPLIFNTGM
jgi:hypothetical protein